MKTVEKRLRNTSDRLRKLGDQGILDLAEKVESFRRQLEKRLCSVVRLRWMLRALLVLGLTSLSCTGWSYLKIDSELDLDMSSWNEIVSIASNGVELCFFLIPVLLSIFFIERYFERGLLLSMLSYLELMNDSIYDEQFDNNPFELEGKQVKEKNSWLLEYLDCCTALLLTVRMLAQSIAQQSSDKIVLDRCGIVRRGAGDNHTRILLKIGILKTAVNDISESSQEMAVFGNKKVVGFSR